MLGRAYLWAWGHVTEAVELSVAPEGRGAEQSSNGTKAQGVDQSSLASWYDRGVGVKKKKTIRGYSRSSLAVYALRRNDVDRCVGQR